MKNNNTLHIGQLPELRILPSKEIKFHESPDQNISERLIARIEKDGFLKNPPIVGRTPAGEYILLDGANRTNALNMIGIKHTCVQLIDIDDPLLSVSAWSHAIERPIRKHLLELIQELGDDYLNSYPESGDQYLLEVLFSEGDTIAVPKQKSLEKDISLLHKITSLYLHQGRMDRVSYYKLEDLARNYPDFSALFKYPEIDKRDLVKMALSGLKVPSGITRILLPKRALHFNMPIAILAADKTLEEKNHWLDNNIIERVRSKSIRFYREPTFIFDE